MRTKSTDPVVVDIVGQVHTPDDAVDIIRELESKFVFANSVIIMPSDFTEMVMDIFTEQFLNNCSEKHFKKYKYDRDQLFKDFVGVVMPKVSEKLAKSVYWTQLSDYYEIEAMNAASDAIFDVAHDVVDDILGDQIGAM